MALPRISKEIQEMIEQFHRRDERNEVLAAIFKEVERGKERMKAGEEIDDQFPVFLSPMASITRYPFRRISKELGADFTITELISTHSVVKDLERVGETGVPNPKLHALIYSRADEQPVGVQLFGGDPDYFAEASRVISRQFDFQFIDINVGCPKRKVAKKGAGAILLRPPLTTLEEIINAVTSSTSLPVSMKIRLGWKRPEDTSLEAIKIAERYDLWCVGVHGRFASDGYDVSADVKRVGELARQSSIPVIGNGDIFSLSKLVEYKQSGVQGVMIGRGAMRNPFLFMGVETPSRSSLLLLADYLIELSRATPVHRLMPIKKVLMAEIAGFAGVKQYRLLLSSLKTDEQLDEFLAQLWKRIEESEKQLLTTT